MHASSFNLMAQMYKHLLACTDLPKSCGKPHYHVDVLHKVYANDSHHRIYATDSVVMFRLEDSNMATLGNQVKNAIGDYTLELDGKRLYAAPAPEKAPTSITFDRLFDSFIKEKGSLSTHWAFNSHELERVFKAYRILGINPDFTICSKVLYLHGQAEGLAHRTVTLECIMMPISR